MKKHYLLTIAASLACSLAANAETLLPDSTIVYSAKGAKSEKTVYSYTDKQSKEKEEHLAWNAEKSEWTPSWVMNYTYDEAGNNIGQLYQVWNGTKYNDSQSDTYIYDDQGRLTLRDLKAMDGNRHLVESYVFNGDEVTYMGRDTTWDANGDFTYYYLNEKRILNEAGLMLKVTSYSLDWKTIYQTSEKEYDAENRQITDNVKNFLEDGEVDFLINYTWEYDGKSYIQLQRSKKVSATDWDLVGYKYEVKEGNPEEITEYLKYGENGEWKVTSKSFNYYPESEATASESIVTPASTLQIFASNGTLTVTTARKELVQVYDLTGRCRYQATVDGSATINNLPKGLYIVAAGKERCKVIVR